MVSGIPPVGITQSEGFLSCDILLIRVRYVKPALSYVFDCILLIMHVPENRRTTCFAISLTSLSF
jgi:hypothetical protein